MKTLFPCLMLAALPGFGGQPGAQLAPIAVFSQFEQQPPPAVVDALHAEVETLMGPAGLRFEWRSMDAEGRSRPAVELAVVTFKGNCDPDSLARQDAYTGALGWTHVSDGVILPFSDVDCGRIHNFLQRAMLAVNPAGRRGVFGRALGRVLAHELYHIFADTAHHGSCGVAKAAYTAQELSSAEFQFEEREMLALQAGKAYLRLESANPQ